MSALKAAKFPIGSTIPSEGATGWADTWMLAAKAPHPNCAYLWMQYISTPKVQAEQATNYGETPDNKLACSYMNKLVARLLRAVPRQRSGVPEVHRAVEDAGRHLRQRAGGLRAVLPVGDRMEYPGQVSQPTGRAGRAPGPPGPGPGRPVPGTYRSGAGGS